MRFVRMLAATALLFGGSAIATAQTPEPKSKNEPGAPTQGPTNPSQTETTPNASTGVGSRPIGPPSTSQPAPDPNPTGVSKEKMKSEQDDPRSGGKKQ